MIVEALANLSQSNETEKLKLLPLVNKWPHLLLSEAIVASDVA